MDSEWKFLSASVIGTSHEKRNDPCQDYALVRECFEGDDHLLILICSDGAGSCSLSHEGAVLACEAVFQAASCKPGQFIDHRADGEFLLRAWFGLARERLGNEAAERGVLLRDFSCTLLAAFISRDIAYFGQIGDGVIVIRNGDILEPVFWPQSGEYVNTTNFLTSDDYDKFLATRAVDVKLDELAMLTDGLKPLALHYASRSVHAPFFDPMFQSLRAWDSAIDLPSALKEFLASDRVNGRTDDDKTLIIASRIPASK